jgi:predicted CoA-binding protein
MAGEPPDPPDPHVAALSAPLDARAMRDRARAILDLQEGRGPVPLLDDAGIGALLRRTRRIAIVGASDDPARPSHDVFRYLRDEGFDCVPVNPNVDQVLNVRAYPSLLAAVAATGPFDIVDVFRRSELCAAHAHEAVDTRSGCLWLQLGVVSWEAARIAHEGGLAVVMDRCTAIEWRRLAPDHPDVSG